MVSGPANVNRNGRRPWVRPADSPGLSRVVYVTVHSRRSLSLSGASAGSERGATHWPEGGPENGAELAKTDGPEATCRCVRLARQNEAQRPALFENAERGDRGSPAEESEPRANEV